MDDDIVFDTTVLERTHSLLCGLKDVYKESVLSGAMMNLESPTQQYENTAHWGKSAYIVWKRIRFNKQSEVS